MYWVCYHVGKWRSSISNCHNLSETEIKYRSFSLVECLKNIIKTAKHAKTTTNDNLIWKLSNSQTQYRKLKINTEIQEKIVLHHHRWLQTNSINFLILLSENFKNKLMFQIFTPLSLFPSFITPLFHLLVNFYRTERCYWLTSLQLSSDKW